MGISRRLSIGLAILIAVASLAAPAVESSESRLSAAGQQVVSRTVLVAVANSGDSAAKAVVTVEALVQGATVVSSAEAVVGAGQTADVAVSFPADVQSVIVVGISEDLSPVG